MEKIIGHVVDKSTPGREYRWKEGFLEIKSSNGRLIRVWLLGTIIQWINIGDKLKIEAEKIKEFKVFLENPEFTLKNSLEGLRSEIDSEIASILKRFLPAQRIPFVSARTWEGFEDLLAVLHEAKCVCGDLT